MIADSLSRRVANAARALVLVAVIAAFLPACGDRSGSPSPITGPVLAGPVPDFQREILADGIVTFAEYERAVLATIACIEAASPHIEVFGPALQGDILTYGYGTGGSPEEREALELLADEAGDRCEREHLAFVGTAWHNQSMPSEREQSELLGSLVACLREAGATVSDVPDHAELGALRQPFDGAVTACFDAHTRYFIIPVEILDLDAP